MSEITERAAHITAFRHESMTNLQTFSGGFPAGGDGGGGKGGHSDRTGMLALKVDPFVRDRQLFDAALELARDALREADRIIRTSTMFEKADEPLPSCRSCVRARDWKGNPIYAPVHHGTLCQFCYRWEKDNKAWPPIPIINIHHNGQRISERDVAIHTKAART